MKSKDRITYRPFENLRTLLGKRALAPAGGATRQAPADDESDAAVVVDPVEERSLFLRAMENVKPVLRNHPCVEMQGGTPAATPGRDPDEGALARLEELVRCGEGFVVSDTAEYMEGIGYGVPPELARRLHEGEFSIQGHLDLHGHLVGEAKIAFEQFLQEAIEAGKRAVLIIHGRGLSSRDGPVLKTKVKEWLTCGRWRKWVVAFTSARACDGGAGATYVLLRQRPVTKRYRKGSKP
jgi:DNA-nicking Smr family endonuclease